MKKCNILILVQDIPPAIKKWLREGEVLFKWPQSLISVNMNEELPEPYVIETDVPLIRLDKRLLRDLDDPELDMILNYAKWERDLQAMGYSDKEMIDAVLSDLLPKKYGKKSLNSLMSKVAELYGS